MPSKFDEQRSRWKNTSLAQVTGYPFGLSGSWGVTSVSHAVTGLLRRFGTEQPSQSHNPPSSTQENCINESKKYYQPQSKSIPPFQPPPLYPISLSCPKHSSQDSARLLTRSLAEEIRLLVPPRLQLCEEWNMIYNLDEDGVSLTTLYKNCSEFRGLQNGFVLVVRDRKGDVKRLFPKIMIRSN